MGAAVSSKKMALPAALGRTRDTGHIGPKMVRIGPMARPTISLNRRKLMTGLAAVAMSQVVVARSQERRGLLLSAHESDPFDATMKAEPAVWSLSGPPIDHGAPIFRRGDELEITFMNLLPVPAVLNWYGIDGAPGAEPLFKPTPLPKGTLESRETFVAPLRHAGTYMFDLGLLGDGQKKATRPLEFVVREREPIEIDRDVSLLIEERRLRTDGTSIAPGVDAQGTPVFYSSTWEISARTNERLRFRFINGSHRSVIAIKIEKFDVRVMAIDSQPAEPFLARDGQLVLAPGTRIDAFVDATAAAGTTSSILLHDGKESRPICKLTILDKPPIRTAPLPPALPLPSNGLPARLDLKNALRVDLALGGAPTDWLTPVSFAATSAPAFRVKFGRTAVLALTNRAAIPTVFHLHGHHFRLLDRLDDGWKPFWLDTLAIEAGQTQRIAFAAEYAGRWLIEAVETNWAAPRLVRWYSVE
jgi:FtsP/CotA-like multicopper oxidase with cupredoxin domain